MGKSTGLVAAALWMLIVPVRPSAVTPPSPDLVRRADAGKVADRMPRVDDGGGVRLPRDGGLLVLLCDTEDRPADRERRPRPSSGGGSAPPGKGYSVLVASMR